MVKDQKGFTLVELMVVVAMIGLLSAVAVPNFKKYQAKSKIAEAKLQLSAIYTAETAFFSDYNLYGTCLRYMGFDPSKEISNRYYSVGFSGGNITRNPTAEASAINSGLKITECPDNGNVTDNGTNRTSWYPAGKGIGGSVMGDDSMGTLNAAGAFMDCTETEIGGTGSATVGACIGEQADAETMVFQAAAVGYISADFLTPETASGLNLNHNKILKSVVNGY